MAPQPAFTFRERNQIITHMKQYADIPDFLNDLPPDKKAQVELLRTIIKAAEPSLTEHIKWNAPSYVFDGMDRVTFNLLNKEGLVKLVLHVGGTRPENKKGTPVMSDDSGLIAWQSDIRGILTFTDLADIKAKQKTITDILSRWLAIS